jgi:ubiquitin-like protein 4
MPVNPFKRKSADMTELSFARSFLSALDMRPVKLSSDHIADPKQYPAQAAVCLLPSSARPISD